MNRKASIKKDAFAGNDPSVVRVNQVFADLEETLADADLGKLVKTPQADSALDILANTGAVLKEDTPEICHDNICDPADVHFLHAEKTMRETAVNEADMPLTPASTYTGMPDVNALREKRENKEEENSVSGLPENFILQGHSYL